MMAQKLLVLVSLVCFSLAGFSQKIVYSEPDRNDTRRMDFEIIGNIYYRI
jgi:hypothetical protein